MNTYKRIKSPILVFLVIAFFASAENPVFAFQLNPTPKKKSTGTVVQAKNSAITIKAQEIPSLPNPKPAPRGDRMIIFNIPRRELPVFSMAKEAGSEHGVLDTRIHGGVLYSLKDCIDIAVKNNLPMQIAQKSVKLAEMRLFEARRNLLPSASLDYQEYHGRINGQAYVGRKQILEGQQPIFHGGELIYTMKQAEVNMEITKNDYNRIRNELVLQVKKAYYSLAKARGNLNIQDALSKEVDKSLDIVTAASAAGIISKIEALNVSSQAGQAKYQLASAEGDVSIAELLLKQAMNADSKDEIDIKESLEFKKVTVDYEKAIAIAMVNRPEIKINSMMIDYYNYGKGIAKAKFWPKVDLLGSWGLAKEEISPPDVIAGNATDADQKLAPQWYAGLKVGMPFWGSSGEYSLTKEHWVPVVSTTHGTDATTMEFKFKVLDKLDTLSGKQLAEIDYDKAKQEFTKIRQDVSLEVKESYFNYRKALIQSETAENKVKYQASDLELAKIKRGMDEAPDSNVIESMIKLGQEKFSLLQALADCHTSLASVNKAIGIEDYYKDE